MNAFCLKEKPWIDERIKRAQIDKYLDKGADFIPHGEIEQKLRKAAAEVGDPAYVRDIFQKSLKVETLTPDETAALLHVEDPQLWEEMHAMAARIKTKVYDNRIVTFAPLYLSNLCVNDCQYCGFRRSNPLAQRNILTMDAVRRETEVLAGTIGHKRLIVVYGEHPRSDAEYIKKSIEAIYSVKMKTKKGWGSIRRVNVNAAPLRVEELKELKDIGIGTFQVFQETYHRDTYARVHPAGTLKANYAWRLTCMHRAMEAGVDDVGLGVLFGLYDWRFEVMGLLYHAIELERKFGIGPHTISFPRLEPANNTPFASHSRYRVTDEDLKKIITIIRLAVPYTGMILTAREPAAIRRQLIPVGVTQTDASTKIGVGAYQRHAAGQENERQQFILGDTRSLDEVIRELAHMGYITSFCTAGYRCGRTGQKIMNLLKTGREGQFCKLNAVLTFREWLDDFASDATKQAARPVIQKEIEEIKEKVPSLYPLFAEYYQRVSGGERDLYI